MRARWKRVKVGQLKKFDWFRESPNGIARAIFSAPQTIANGNVWLDLGHGDHIYRDPMRTVEVLILH